MGVVCARAAFAGICGNRLGLGQKRGAFASAVPVVSESRFDNLEQTGIEETGFLFHPATGFAALGE